MKLVKVNPFDLVDAPWNPPIRTMIPKMKLLMASIEIYGVIYPPLISQNLVDIIEGHRRIACLRILGIKEQTCLTNDTNASAEELYETMNTTTRKMNNNEVIYVYTHGGNVSVSQLAKIKELESLLGRKYLEELGQNYISTNILTMTKQVSSYCKNTDKAFMKTVLLWIINNKQNMKVRVAISNNVKPQVLEKIIMDNRELKSI